MSIAAGISLRPTQSLAIVLDNAAPVVIARAEGLADKRNPPAEPDERPGKPKSFLRRFAFGDKPAASAADTFSSEHATTILTTLKNNTNANSELPIDGAVIAVPAYFHDGQRMALRDAATAAGWSVLALVNEPTAAALATGLLHEKRGHVLVYDLAPSRFDVTVLKVHEDRLEVLAADGLRNFSPVGDGGLEQTRPPCLAALKYAGLTPADIDAVVPVGAQTQTDGVRALLTSLFDQEPLTRFDPEEIVAIGAAVQGVVLANR